MFMNFGIKVEYKTNQTPKKLLDNLEDKTESFISMKKVCRLELKMLRRIFTKYGNIKKSSAAHMF